ncbi:hypothetical protein RO3G_13259 [Rhizopus delemar RA 99-880]|uniref:Uncharacterized protein n=3 Tax=Rhizopus TaxID=4842 RepID=I1CJB8_RHIO9|nr:hypothetical protein RO3G_13259 [Rhizopus delemar RA 99-880]|eukprot:EIE88548.1 hypothetical protein RO3G_13259 [Rhizopus delemar RA 99-880]
MSKTKENAQFETKANPNSEYSKKPVVKTGGLVSSYLSAFEPSPSVKKDLSNTRKILKRPVQETPKFPIEPPKHIQLPEPMPLVKDTLQKTDKESNKSDKIYLPQLSPELKFTEDHSLSDISSTDGDDTYPQEQQQRPMAKKRVSFNEELTFIPTEESPMPMERKEEGVMIKELLFALNHAEPMGKKPWQAPKEPVELKPPKRTVQKETKKEPQKLSNKLLDMFQPKKSKPAVDLNAITPTKELTHPTKFRPRKPPSLRKNQVSLSVPAATAQPDWRVRTTTKKFEFVA